MGACQAHWKSWLPYWIVVAAWVLIGFASSFGLRVPEATFWILMPFFFIAWFRATNPYIRKQVTFSQQTFWVLLMPFGIALVLGLFRWFFELLR